MTSHNRPPFIRSGSVKWIVLGLLIVLGFIFMWPGLSVDDIDIFVPIEASNLPPGLTVVKPLLEGFEIRVHGPKAVLQKVSKMKLQYTLNLANVKPGVQSVRMEPDLISLPRGLSIVALNPPVLTIKIENEMQKELPIEFSFVGEPAAGFLIAEANSSPGVAVLRGPASILAPLTTIMTKPVDVNGLSETFKKEIALDLAEGLKLVSSSQVVTAEVKITEKIATKSFTKIPIQVRDTPYRYQIKPETINIEVKGPVHVLENLVKNKKIVVYIDLKGHKPGKYEKQAAISLPVKTTLLRANPETFTVILRAR